MILSRPRDARPRRPQMPQPIPVVIWLILLLSATSAGLAAQRQLDRTDRFPFARGKQVVIDGADCAITVRSADIRELIVTTQLSISGVSEERGEAWIARHTPVFEDTDQSLTITVKPGRNGFLGLGLLTAKARIGVVVPTAAVPDITTTSGIIRVRGDFPEAEPLRLRTATGDMELYGAATSIDVRSASGDARIELVRPLQSLFARTASGDITLNGGARQVHVDTASGDIWLVNLSGSARVTSSTGKLTLRWDRLEADATVEARTSSSPIHLVLPESTSPHGTLRTVSGTIRSDHPGRVNDQGDTVVLEGDGPLIEAETASGQLTLGSGEGWDITAPVIPEAPRSTHRPLLE